MILPGIFVGDWEIPEDELEETFDTSGGPGGQHANRNKTAVTLKFDLLNSSMPSGMVDQIRERFGHDVVTVTASDSRSQWRNRALARARLKTALEEALRETKLRKPTRPTRASKKRRIEAKRKRSELKKSRKPPDGW
jgi:ribosome-associated protein